MSKRGLWLFFLLIISVSALADFPVSEEEAVAAIAKPSVARIEVSCSYQFSVEKPYLQGDELVAGETVDLRQTDSRSGSGFVVSKDGYVMTNAHVVLPYEGVEAIDFLIPYLVDVFSLEDLPPAQVRAYFLNHFTMTQSESTRIIVRLPAYLNGNVIGKMYPADLKRVGDPYPGLDLALLKIDASNLPTLSLGTTSQLGGGNRVIVIGFPKAAELTGAVFDSTVTSGIISSKKESDEGFSVFQMDAAVETGSSGGPVLDSSGKVVGVETLSWSSKQGFNYFIPAEEVKEFLSDAFVLPEEGVVRKVYERALVHFWDKRFDNAIEDFRAVQDIYPDHPYAPGYLLQARISLEQRQPGDYNVFFLSIGAFLVLLVIVMLIVILKEKHKIEVLQHR